MHEIEKIYEAYKLKQVNRAGNVLQRKETTAEHIYSSMILARYFLKKVKGLDEAKVMKLILYHDLCEIYARDKYTFDKEEIRKKEIEEDKAVKKLLTVLPAENAGELEECWKEWKERKTPEAKFCKVIDALDPAINELERPDKWKKYGYTEKKFRDTKEKYVSEFPEMKDFFEEMIKEYKKRGLIVKE
jgi:putative hydrolase of HD superfamily